MSGRIELIEAFSIEVAEQIQRETLQANGIGDEPLFRHRNGEWLDFKARYIPGDELYGFRDTYGTACGYVLVRDGRGHAWFIVGAHSNDL